LGGGVARRAAWAPERRERAGTQKKIKSEKQYIIRGAPLSF